MVKRESGVGALGISFEEGLEEAIEVSRMKAQKRLKMYEGTTLVLEEANRAKR